MPPYVSKSFVTLCGIAVLWTAPAFADKVVITTTAPIVGDHVIVHRDIGADKKTVADTVDFMIRDLTCDKNEDCHTIGFGDKPCGGFTSYKIYSQKTVNQPELKKIVSQYNDLEKEQNEDNGMMSTCEALLEPAVACVQNQCAVITTGAGAPLPQ